MTRSDLLCLSLLAALPRFLQAQAPDSPQIKQHLDAAKKIAGTEWAAEVNFFCRPMPYANKPDDPLLEPTKIFDNVYALGRLGTTVYAIPTSEGIVLIDSGYPDQLDSVLLPQMQKASLDPAKVKYIFLGHGHGDHFGGAKYFQDKYGTHVVLSNADWDFMEKPNAKGKLPPGAPKRDMIAMDQQPITVGDFTITPVLIPGHTPGSLAYVFPVKDGGKTHMAGLYGGTVLIPRIAWNLQEYLSSLRHWAEAAKKMKVDVELQNHPLYDNMGEKLAKLKARKPGQPNPFVVGEASYQKFVNVISECTQVQIARINASPDAKP
jgi:metallo-beta-lactamase class B